MICSLQTKSTKRLARDVTDTCTTHADYVMTSKTQTARHKMSALTAVSSRLSNVDFKQTKLYYFINRLENRCECIYLFLFYLFLNSTAVARLRVAFKVLKGLSRPSHSSDGHAGRLAVAFSLIVVLVASAASVVEVVAVVAGGVVEPA